MRLGYNIRKFREEKNYTQEYMSERLNISQNTYSKIETGGIKLTIDRLMQISEILETPIEVILVGQRQSAKLDDNAVQKLYESLKFLQEDKKELTQKTVEILHKQLEFLREENQKLINIIDKLTK